jgi:hypothetical protein
LLGSSFWRFRREPYQEQTDGVVLGLNFLWQRFAKIAIFTSQKFHELTFSRVYLALSM